MTVQDGFIRFANAYTICNKEAGTVARVLIQEHFSVFGLPDKIHHDNGNGTRDAVWKGSRCKGGLPSLQHHCAHQHLPVNWIYLVPKADREMELSDWTEVMQERFQMAYFGMRERPQVTVHLNAQFCRPLVSQFEVGQWACVFDSKIVPGSCDKLRLGWTIPDYQKNIFSISRSNASVWVRETQAGEHRHIKRIQRREWISKGSATFCSIRNRWSLILLLVLNRKWTLPVALKILC